jgi:protein-tyrosine phosphatase
MAFINFPIQDRGVPDLQKFDQFLANLEKQLADSKRIGVHCRGCIGRASVVAASLLIRSGISAADASSQVEIARDAPVPDTLEQLEWVNRHIRSKP